MRYSYYDGCPTCLAYSAAQGGQGAQQHQTQGFTNTGFFGGAYDDDIECQEAMIHADPPHVDDIMMEDAIPEVGQYDEEEECNDEDCEYCRQYYL